ncbi:MAG: isochorismatase family protein [Rhizobiales bacterium]|jgi:nicotinamidase-related amidase|nr:isochorismatase family protein [Hyphomicrobiales bacterium]
MSDIQRDYDKAGFGGHIMPGQSRALLIVDPARAYADPACPLYAGVEKTIEAMKILLAAARRGPKPVFFTRVVHDPKGLSGGTFFRKVPSLQWLSPESPYSAYIEGLAPGPGDIEITKQYPSAFAGTSLAASLRALGVDTVVIAGLTTSGCIRATATDTMQSGFIPIVAREAVGDRQPGPHEANLFDIQAKIGEVISLQDAMALFG